MSNQSEMLAALKALYEQAAPVADVMGVDDDYRFALADAQDAIAAAESAPTAPDPRDALIAELVAALRMAKGYVDDACDGRRFAKSDPEKVDAALAKAAALTPPPADAEISRMFTLSTSHLSPLSDEKLSNGEAGVSVAHMKGDYGWFIYAGDNAADEGDDEMPSDLAACIAKARALGCEWLCLDRDGPVMADLMTFDW